MVRIDVVTSDIVTKTIYNIQNKTNHFHAEIEEVFFTTELNTKEINVSNKKITHLALVAGTPAWTPDGPPEDPPDGAARLGGSCEGPWGDV